MVAVIALSLDLRVAYSSRATVEVIGHLHRVDNVCFDECLAMWLWELGFGNDKDRHLTVAKGGEIVRTWCG